MSKKGSPVCRSIALAVAVSLSLAAAWSEAGENPIAGDTGDLTSLSLEDLMNLEVTSVARQKQRIADAPAAVYVITQDEIARSGMTSIPELLRLSPGVDVARFNQNQWGISTRGMNSQFSQELLVLMDGRTVYTPLFSGVYWESQDYILDDLDRIEVIRGPGSTVWGSNAVNGVINITTKSARDTQGGLVEGNLANDERIGGVRYGGTIDEQTFYRVYAKYRTQDDGLLASGDEDHDGWDAQRAGFRIDRYATPQDVLTLQGDISDARYGVAAAVPIPAPPFIHQEDRTFNTSGGNVLGRWTHTISDRSDWSLQAYYDHFVRDDIRYGYQLDTFDIDFQHRFPLMDRHEVIWGAGYRYWTDTIAADSMYDLHPQARDWHIGSTFIQDDWTLVPERLHLFAGSKFEVNSSTGFEYQPSVRAIYTPSERMSFWGAISRAIRLPSRLEEDIDGVEGYMPSPLGGVVAGKIIGSRSFESENLTAYEAGWRWQPQSSFSLDVATFYHDYDNLRSTSLGNFIPPSPTQPISIVEALVGNDSDASAYGVEVASTLAVTSRWRLSGSYTALIVHASSPGAELLSAVPFLEGSAPKAQVQLHSCYDLTSNIQINASAYYVDNIGEFGLPPYIRTDASIRWMPRKDLNVSVGIRNAFDDRHPEFGSSLQDVPTEPQREAYLQVDYRF